MKLLNFRKRVKQLNLGVCREIDLVDVWMQLPHYIDECYTLESSHLLYTCVVQIRQLRT